MNGSIAFTTVLDAILPSMEVEGNFHFEYLVHHYTHVYLRLDLY